MCKFKSGIPKIDIVSSCGGKISNSNDFFIQKKIIQKKNKKMNIDCNIKLQIMKP